MFTQLNPPIPLNVLGKGHGYAIGMIDYGQEHNLVWVTAIDETGEIWCAPNPLVRMDRNWTMSRPENPLVAAEKAARRGQAGEAHRDVPGRLCETCAADGDLHVEPSLASPR